MKLLGYLIVVVSLVAGVMAAVTAYLPRLSLPDESLLGLTLNAPAGPGPKARGAAPVASSGATLTPEILAQLRTQGVTRVRVREFSPGRWSGAWIFGASAVGLLVGGLLVRSAARARDPLAGEGGGTDAETALESIRGIVGSLRRDLPGLPDDASRNAAVLERLGEVQREHAPAFVRARTALLAARGLAGFAQIADRFATAERQINRAWSAAADNQASEAAECLERATTLLEATAERLRA